MSRYAIGPGVGQVLELPMNPGEGWNQHQFTGWTLAVDSGGMIFTTDGTTTGDWTSIIQNGPLLSWPAAFSKDCQVPECGYLQAYLEFDAPTADDIGVGIGIVNNPTIANPSVWLHRMSFKDAVGQTMRDSGNLSDITRATGFAYTGGSGFNSSASGVRGAFGYTPGNRTSFHHATLMGAAFSSFLNEDAHIALFLKGGANPGNVRITRLKVILIEPKIPS